jgi:hypothetical protein
MMSLRKLALLAVLAAAPAYPDILFTLSPGSVVTPPGGLPDVTCQNGSQMCIIFGGDITAVDADFDLNGIAFSIDSGPDLTALQGVSAFTFSVFGPPGFLAQGVPYDGPIFEIDVSSLAPVGFYSGTVMLLGAPDPDSTTLNVLASQTFQIEVAPEPSTYALILMGLAALMLLRRTSDYTRERYAPFAIRSLNGREFHDSGGRSTEAR